MNTEAQAETKFTPDQAAAHQFLTELRTRISTQPLPYQYGVEARALESMWEVFGHARAAIKGNTGCEEFALRTSEVLNKVVRPLTGKWHRAFAAGRLNGRDGADEFRGELSVVQEGLQKFAEELHRMAYGKPHTDALTPEVMQLADLHALFHPLPFGFTAHTPGLKEIESEIRADEAAAVRVRREKWASSDAEPAPSPTNTDAIGLALSGGGIRSATFSLGVVQVLAKRGLLKEVDFLSTVSGGGYTGCFLTQRLGNGEPLDEVAGPRGPDPEPVRYLRQRAKFLSGIDLKERWSMVTATLAGMLLNWTPLLLVIAVLALGANVVAPQIPFSGSQILRFLVALSVLAMIVYCWGMRQGKKASQATGRAFGILVAAAGITSVGWFIDSFFPGLLKSIQEHSAKSFSIGTAMAAGAAAVPGIIRFLPILKNPKTRKVVLQIALFLAGLLVPLTGILLFYTFRGMALHQSTLYLGVLAASVVVSLLLLNINLTAPHRLYRDALARTFIQKSADGPLDPPLAEINPQGTAPYHLINAALNIPTSVDYALKDRGCDFFLFSKNWIGASSIRYQRTGEWRANGDDVDLATAMAVSGAAFSSYMGLGSKPTLTALLTLLNVRLGFWIKKPPATGFGAPGFMCLLREVFGLGMSEKDDWLNLSDGGHIENLALYELLRRRCKLIICVDGEADPDFTFHGLMTLVRHAQIDFGIRIDPRLDDLRPKSATGFSESHFHLCRIHYPEGVGLLLYLKLSVTGNESELIKRYRFNHPEFPHQATLDQFFDQEQFEAYRQLGVHAAEALFLPALMSGQNPKTVHHWFLQLAKNLLEPKP
jgi:hypothetical protein